MPAPVYQHALQPCLSFPHPTGQVLCYRTPHQAKRPLPEPAGKLPLPTEARKHRTPLCPVSPPLLVLLCLLKGQGQGPIFHTAAL
jgi:hypothetical protein